jgi:transcriptional regulator with XRE-family HTH domain
MSVRYSISSSAVANSVSGMLSQEALAHESGMGRTYLSGVERSERNVSIENIARIARGLRVEPWKLLRDD